jgi:hypothetical protein
VRTSCGGETKQPDHQSTPRETPDEHVRREHRAYLSRQVRIAYLAGAQLHMREVSGRGLTNEELVAVIGQYPGDLPITPTEP